MKKPKAKGQKIAAKKTTHISIEDMAELESFPKRLPPTTEIAQLAALLAHGIPVAKRNPEILAGQAISIWLTCNQYLKEWNEFLTDKIGHWRPFLKTPQFKEIMKLPEPESFPVGLDDFLKLALPAKRPEDRMKVFRELLRHNDLTETQVVQYIQYFRVHGFDGEWYKVMHLLRIYAKKLGRENRAKRAQAGGRARMNRVPTAKNSRK